MTSAIWSGSSRNCGIVGWPAMIPSASGRCRFFNRILQMQRAERRRNRERALADLVDGVALRAINAHKDQASLRCRCLLCESRLARAQ